MLLPGSATGVFRSRTSERATSKAVPRRFIAGTLHPDHETLATVRRTFVSELKDLFMHVLVLAQEAGVLKLGTIHADASTHHAVRSRRLLEVEAQLRSKPPGVPDGLVARGATGAGQSGAASARGRPPTPPMPGFRDGDQDHVADPQSRLINNPTDAGFEQDDHAPVAVDQGRLLSGEWSLSLHPNDR